MGGSISQRRSENISHLLGVWADGDDGALDRLLPLLYRELRQLARRHMRRERRDHSLQTTALLNEAYLRLVQQRDGRPEQRAQFFAAAAGIMRRILVDHARARACQKRAGAAVRVAFDEMALPPRERGVDLIALDDALDELEHYDRRKLAVVELRYFGGLSVDETAAALNVAPITVKRDWAIAKAFLYRRMKHRVGR